MYLTHDSVQMEDAGFDLHASICSHEEGMASAHLSTDAGINMQAEQSYLPHTHTHTHTHWKAKIMEVQQACMETYMEGRGQLINLVYLWNGKFWRIIP